MKKHTPSLSLQFTADELARIHAAGDDRLAQLLEARLILIERQESIKTQALRVGVRILANLAVIAAIVAVTVRLVR